MKKVIKAYCIANIEKDVRSFNKKTQEDGQLTCEMRACIKIRKTVKVGLRRTLKVGRDTKLMYLISNFQNTKLLNLNCEL